jgi:adenylate cyclase
VTVEAEKAKVEELLARILPEPIARELRTEGRVEPRFFPAATILFADVKGFTQLAERIEPAILIGMLDRYFAAFDDVIVRRGLEKLKTIGDAYVAVGGVPTPDRNHVMNACLASLDMQAAVRDLNVQRSKLRLPCLDVRIGLHTGPVIAGVVGRRRFTYDIWGDAVNIAAAMEANGEPGRINISEKVYQHVRGNFSFTARGVVPVKNRDGLAMYFLEGVVTPSGTSDAKVVERVAGQTLP